MNEGGKHVMDTFADYVLEEEDLASKMEIVYYLSKKTKIFFDKSVIFKTELLRMFLNYSKVQVDNNLILTASLLCNCRKYDFRATGKCDDKTKFTRRNTNTYINIKEI